MSVRLLDIARHAKVSLGVVSTVVNHSKSNTVVSPDTRKRILSAAKELGYVPNAAARSMQRGRFNRIACAVVQYGKPGTTYVPTNGYLDTAADTLAESGYALVLEPMHLVPVVDDFVTPPRLFKELAVDGILGLPMTGYVPPQLDAQLAKLGAPVVWLNRKPVADGQPWLYCDEAPGAQKLVRHLVGLGHRRIGYLGFSGLHYSVQDRYAAVLAAVAAAGLDTAQIALADREASMMDEAERLLDVTPALTAVICFQRRGYDALLHAAARRGLRVPAQLSIAYFASAWEHAGDDVRRTVVAVPEPRLAEAGVKLLLRLIEGKSAGRRPPGIPGVLQVGETTVKPAAGKRPAG